MQDRNELTLALLSRALVWGSLFAVIYVLRSFSVLLFLVFIFSYIQANAVNRIEPWIANRTARVVLVGASFLTFFILVVAALIPPVRDQTVSFVNNLAVYGRALDQELIGFTEAHPALAQLMPLDLSHVPRAGDWDYRTSALAQILQPFLGVGEDLDKDSLLSLVEKAGHLGSKLLKLSSQFVLSILFSFLIVLDLPNLAEGTRSLRDTRLRYVYDEVTDSLLRFGATVGRAFEAQFIVAIFNTLLTAVGVWCLGLRDEIAFISLVVFLCSFIPIAGVIISSVPICLLALTQGGFPKVILALVLIFAIHAIEAYILNPRIFGRHLHLNPVVVMILLTICGKLFGVWGLILSLPIATYLFREAIQHKQRRPQATGWPTHRYTIAAPSA
ncbi:MAG: AI-2E family transporter [Candidatus Eremiobacteraeota bacterium]|nr:AI-2E family transporter [Candidatus Eremiobacteraeota bacterium]